VADRLAACQARLLALLGGSLAAQAASLLAEEAVDGRVELPQLTLAAMLGVARPSLNKVLKDLERDGLIKISYGTIEVLDRARLTARAPNRPAGWRRSIWSRLDWRNNSGTAIPIR
jgi:CRP/FNR family transcriptional regulator, cAMP and macrophage regulator